MNPPKYDGVWDFTEGLAQVQLNGKWLPYDFDCDTNYWKEGKRCFVNTQGKEVNPPKYGWVWHFTEGLAQVKLNGKWGFIDKTGKEMLPPKYDKIIAYSPTKFHARETGASPWLMIEIIDAMCSVCGKPESEVKELIDGPHSSVCIDCINRAQTILQNPQNPKS